MLLALAPLAVLGLGFIESRHSARIYNQKSDKQINDNLALSVKNQVSREALKALHS